MHVCTLGKCLCALDAAFSANTSRFNMWSLVSGTGFPFCDSFSNQDKQGHAVCNMQLYESQPCFDFLIRAAWRSFHEVDQNGTTKMDKTRRHTLGLCYAWKACWSIPAKENENKTFHKAVIVSLTTQNQDYEDIKSKMRKMLRTSSFNHPDQTKNVQDGVERG